MVPSTIWTLPTLVTSRMLSTIKMTMTMIAVGTTGSQGMNTFSDQAKPTAESAA